MRIVCVAFILIVAMLGVTPVAHAQKRVALVVGNSDYQHTAKLTNPTNDASDMTAVLGRLGFEVIEGRNLDKRAMERLVRQFGLKLADADLALFFYAGHGLQVGGQNYLVPTDAQLANHGDVDFEALPLNLVLKQMEGEAKTAVVLLDACRDNPLARNLARAMSARSSQVGQGLAEVRTGIGTLIGFATQPGNFALDGRGRNSPYTEALLKHIEVPGKDLSGVLVEVRNDVLKSTGGKQVPWEHTSLTGQVYLKAGPAAPDPSKSNDLSYEQRVELDFWASVKDSGDPSLLQAYIQRYPSGPFVTIARALIEKDESRKKLEAARKTEELSEQQGWRKAAESSSAKKELAPGKSEITSKSDESPKTTTKDTKVAAVPDSSAKSRASDSSASASLVGRWNWATDCGALGRYNGSFEISRVTGNSVSGTFEGSQMRDAQIRGGRLTFKNDVLGRVQHWTLTTAGPSRLNGSYLDTGVTCKATASR